MIVFIMLFIILVLSFGIKIKLKISQEESIFVALFGTVFFTYILGLLNLLKLSIYMIVIITLISLIYVLIKLKKKEEKLTNLFTMPTLIYIVVISFIYYIVKDIKFNIYDEFMFWGKNLKEMMGKSVLWANHQIDGIHLVYPPFTAVCEYVFCKFNGGFSEGVTYFAINSLMFTSVMPLFKNEKYTKKSVFKVVTTILISYVVIIVFGYFISTLYVDCLLGVLFGVAMYLAFKLDDKKDYISLILLLIALTLTKTNGILLAGIVIMQIFFRIIFDLIKEKESNVKNIIKRFGIVIILLITIISSYGIWKLYYTLNGKQVDDRHDKNYVDNIDIGELVNAVLQTDDASQRNKTMVADFSEAILTKKIIEKCGFNTTFWCFVIINIGFIIYIILSKEKLKAFINLFCLNIGFVLYMITMLIVFMFVFQEFQGEVLMGFSRYIATYLMAMTLNLIYLILTNINKKTIVISVVLFFCLQSGLNKMMFDPRNIRGDAIQESTLKNANNIIKNVEETEKVYIIDNNKDWGGEFIQIRYLISPRETNLLYEWNVGSFDDGIFYRKIITEQELMDKLIVEEFDYVYFVSIEEEFLEDFKNIISNDAKKELEKIVIDKKEVLRDYSIEGILLEIDKKERVLEVVY